MSTSPTARPTSKDVAFLSGVSRATVSYVLNRDPRQTISEATRQRVLDAADTLGYVPSAAATSLRRGHSRLVLLALDPLFSGYISDLIVDATTERLRRDGYAVVRHSDENPATLVDVAQATSAVAVLSLTFLTADIRRRLTQVGVTRIIHPETPDKIGPPDRPWELPIGQLQVDHLASRGYDRIIYALPERSPRLPIALARLRGVQIECANLRFEQPQVVELPLDRTVIAERLSAIDRLPGRTAVTAYEDQLAIGVLGAMNDMGWQVKRDLGVIGSDNLPVASLVTPGLTTVLNDAALIGVGAAEQFLQMGDAIADLDWNTGGEMTYSVVERQST